MSEKEEWVIGIYDAETDSWEWLGYGGRVKTLKDARMFDCQEYAYLKSLAEDEILTFSSAKAIEAKWKAKTIRTEKLGDEYRRAIIDSLSNEDESE